jgi:hypothetical protein
MSAPTCDISTGKSRATTTRRDTTGSAPVAGQELQERTVGSETRPGARGEKIRTGAQENLTGGIRTELVHPRPVGVRQPQPFRGCRTVLQRNLHEIPRITGRPGESRGEDPTGTLVLQIRVLEQYPAEQGAPGVGNDRGGEQVHRQGGAQPQTGRRRPCPQYTGRRVHRASGGTETGAFGK